MKIVIAQLNPIVGDLKGNTDKVLGALEVARGYKADILLFPELTLCGYPPEDLLLHDSFIEEMAHHLERVIGACTGITACVGFARRSPPFSEKRLFNSVAIIQDGKILQFYDKWLLPTYDVFDESRYFNSGSELGVFHVRGKKIAVLICEDIWQHAGAVVETRYMRDPVQELVVHKPDFVLNLSASPYHFQKPEERLSVCAQAARTLSCPVVLCCQVGGNDQLVFDGYSLVVNAHGELLKLGKGFEEDIMCVDIEDPPISCPLFYDPLEDMYQALVLGVRDYFHKSGFTKGCLGLSGGIDSALVAVIAAEALGKDNLLAISMPSRYSSIGSVTDARLLADQLEIELMEIPIEGPFAAYLDVLVPQFRNAPQDITEENIQARIRGTILMAISNKFGHVVLSTGNKSELGMGYCTLYGDMCGGLSVIGDVTKTQVYALARFLHAKRGVIPVSSIEKPPSAELRPNQKDSDSLPDYVLLDQVVQGYVEEFLSPEEIADRASIPIQLVKELISKLHKAEYKRRQAAPMIRISKKAFRAGRRYPIVQRWVIRPLA